MTHTQTAVAEWRGRELVGNGGENIGTIDEVYVDASTDQPEWLSVKTGMLGSKVSFVPIAHAQESGDAIPGALREDAGQRSPLDRARR